MPIGVLALQGDVREHIQLLTELGSSALEVRTADQLASCDALVIPGGESTTISKLLVNFGLMDPVKDFVS
ncbi:MAG: pyridoxal 5'-phosphate synthase glutaminase subunit PdxT, partial [Aquiluna sp.]